MDAEQFKRLQDVFLAACDASPDEQARIIAEALGDEPSLRAEVEEMLRHDGASEGRSFTRAMEGACLGNRMREVLPVLVPGAGGGPGNSESEDSGEGTRGFPVIDNEEIRQLGDYRLLRHIRRGGMGVVYEAEQQPLGRHVAIKILPQHSLLDGQQLERFQRET